MNNNTQKKVACTCSKSGCKLKYCECFKIGQECTDLCRCIKCENSKDQKKNEKSRVNKICYVNSISIVDNKISQNIKNNNDKTNFLNKKRRKEKEIRKKNDKKEDNLIKPNLADSNEKANNNDSNGELFDKNGKMIFTHFKLDSFNNFSKL